MRKFLITAVMAVASLCAYGQTSTPTAATQFGGQFTQSAYASYAVQGTNFVPAGSQVLNLNTSTILLSDSRTALPFLVGTPLTVDNGTLQEVVTITQANCTVPNQPCTIVATFTHPHSAPFRVATATFGLQEAINDAHNNGGGTVLVDGFYTTGMLTSAVAYSNVALQIPRAGTFTVYTDTAGVYAPQTFGGGVQVAGDIHGTNSHPIVSTVLNGLIPVTTDGSQVMTGPLVLSGNPTSSLQAADKAYVDAHTGVQIGGDITNTTSDPIVSTVLGGLTPFTTIGGTVTEAATVLANFTNVPAGSMVVNNLLGIYNAYAYNPLSYNGAAIGSTVGGVGLANSLADCYNNRRYTTLANVFTTSPAYIVPCYILFPPQYQLFGDGNGGESPLNSGFIPPTYNDPNIGTLAQYNRVSFINENKDAISETYWNPGVCNWTQVVTGQNNCAGANSQARNTNFVFTNPLFATGSAGNYFGSRETFNLYAGSHNEVVPTSTNVFLNNVDPFEIDSNIYSQGQGGGLTISIDHPAGGDSFSLYLTNTYGGFTSGADQGGGVIWGAGGESPTVYSFAISSSGTKYEAATSYSPPQLWLQSTGAPHGDGPASGPNHFVVDSTGSGYTAGNVTVINTAPTITLADSTTTAGASSGVFEATADTTSANWTTLFGTSGNYFVKISAPVSPATFTMPGYGKSAIPSNASGGGASYGCVPAGTQPLFAAGVTVNGSTVPLYPAPAVCYPFNSIPSGSVPAVGSYVQITSKECTETGQVLYADQTHIVAPSSCYHDASTLIYWGPAVGLAFNMGYDSIAASFTGQDQIDEWHQIAGADNAGDLFVFDFLPKGGTPYVNGYGYKNTTLDTQPVPGAVSLSGTAVAVATPTAGIYVSDTNNTVGAPHAMNGIPVTFSGGTCTTQPTAVFNGTYTSNRFTASSVTMTNAGNCSVAPTATGPVNTPNPYVIRPAANVLGVLEDFRSGNVNNAGLRVAVTPYWDTSTGFSSNPYTGTANAFTTPNTIALAHLTQMDFNFNTQYGAAQFAPNNFADDYASFNYKGFPKRVFEVHYNQMWENFYVLPESSTTPLPNPFTDYGGQIENIPFGQPYTPPSAYVMTGPVGFAFTYGGQLLSGASGEGQAFVGRCANTNGGTANLMPCATGYYAPFYQGGYFASIDGTNSLYYGPEFDITNQVVNFYSDEATQGSATGRELRLWGHTSANVDTVEVTGNLLVDGSIQGGTVPSGKTLTVAGTLNVTGTCTGCSSGSGTVNSGTSGAIAYYPSTGTAVSGTNSPTLTFIKGLATGTSESPGTGAGSSPTVSCLSASCDSMGGAYQIATGTSPTAGGTVITVTMPTRAGRPACVAQLSQNGGTILTTMTETESASGLVIGMPTGVSLSASTTYFLRYWCSGV